MKIRSATVSPAIICKIFLPGLTILPVFQHSLRLYPIRAAHYVRERLQLASLYDLTPIGRDRFRELQPPPRCPTKGEPDGIYRISAPTTETETLTHTN
jgi:hypothetical protein